MAINKVVHVVPYFAPAWAYGGIPRLAYGLAREQARMGIAVGVITTDALDRRSRHPESGATVSMEGGKMTVRYLRNVSNRRAYDDQLFMPTGMKKALGEIAFDADVIHIHGHRHYLEMSAAKFARKNCIPYIVTANGTAPRIERKTGVKFMLDAVKLDGILKKAAAVIAVSKAEIEQYVSRGVKKANIFVIPNGLDVGAFDAAPPKGTFRADWKLDRDPIILYLGKITPRKGLIPLAKAVEIISRRRKVGFVIAGNDMGFLPEVKEEIERLGLKDITVFTGLVRGPGKLAAYVDADVTVYPSEFEIFGLVPFESILCGTPVVVSDDSGCGEIVGGYDIGEPAPYGDEIQLAAAIEKVLDSPKESAERVERGKKIILENFAWEKVAAQTVALYEKVLDTYEKKAGAK